MLGKSVLLLNTTQSLALETAELQYLFKLLCGKFSYPHENSLDSEDTGLKTHEYVLKQFQNWIL